MITLRRLVPVVGLAAVLLSGCGGDSTDAAEAPATASAQATPTATASATASTGVPRPTATPLPTRGAGFPPEALAVHGKKYHAVFLEVAPSLDDPRLIAAHEKANTLGYQGGIGEIDCTPGAREALNLKPDAEHGATSIFFDTRKQAQQFVDAYEGPVVGTAHVTAGCMD